jgi:lysophospholipase L1-like esterase
MQRWDDDVLRLELQRLDPHLIILSYGTNEGFDDELDLDAYEANFRDQITRLKRFAPNASVLITGGPDGARLPFYADTESRDPEEWTCAPLSNAERETYAALIAAESVSLLRWHEPPMLKPVLSVQREVARDGGAAHWNWREAMGGACTVHDWRLADDPQLARPDHVHLTGEGYALSARMLMDALNGAFVAWQGDGKGQAVP